MKNNFVELYKNIQSDKNISPKMFFKLGTVHTARGTSSSGFQEIGNIVYELSNINQTKSFSIIVFPRYIYNEKTNLIDDVIEDDDKEILEFTKVDKWTMIDLKELFKLAIENDIQLSKDINYYIEKYDAIIIPSTTKYSTKDY